MLISLGFWTVGDERGLQLDVREPAAGAGHSLGSVVPYKKTKKTFCWQEFGSLWTKLIQSFTA